MTHRSKAFPALLPPVPTYDYESVEDEVASPRKSPLSRTISKALTPKTAEYHRIKSGTHLFYCCQKTRQAIVSLPAHAAIGICRGAQSAGSLVKKTWTKGSKRNTGAHLINNGLRPAVGVAGGAFWSLHSSAVAAKDPVHSAYHATLYPVAEVHELVRGKPSPRRRQEDNWKLWQFRKDRELYDQEVRALFDGIAHVKYPVKPKSSKVSAKR